ncbi:MAG: hypothetical protein ACR2KK_09010 [Acidimicrobiales bacterium]
MRKTAVVLLAFVLAGCGGNGGDEDSGSSTPTSFDTTTTTVVSTSITSSSTSSSLPTSGSTSTTARGGTLSASSTADLRGVGPVRVGMTLAEASAAAGRRIVAKPAPSPECGFADPEGGPEGVSFMVVSGRIVRVDVAGGPVKTLSGAGVGDTEPQVQARYSNRLQSSPHKYVPAGRYLTLVPTDAADSGFRLIFETDGTKVTRFRVGKQPEVSFIEGCS